MSRGEADTSLRGKLTLDRLWCESIIGHQVKAGIIAGVQIVDDTGQVLQDVFAVECALDGLFYSKARLAAPGTDVDEERALRLLLDCFLERFKGEHAGDGHQLVDHEHVGVPDFAALRVRVDLKELVV